MGKNMVKLLVAAVLNPLFFVIYRIERLSVLLSESLLFY